MYNTDDKNDDNYIDESDDGDDADDKTLMMTTLFTMTFVLLPVLMSYG